MPKRASYLCMHNSAHDMSRCQLFRSNEDKSKRKVRKYRERRKGKMNLSRKNERIEIPI